MSPSSPSGEGGSVDERLRAQMEAAIQEEVDFAKEEVINAAVKEFERRIRRAAGGVAINVSNYFSIQRLGSDLVITVKMVDEKKKEAS